MKKPVKISIVALLSFLLLFFVIKWNLHTASSMEQTSTVSNEQVSKKKADQLIKKMALSLVAPHLEQSLKQSIKVHNNPDGFVGLPATCFAPDSDPAVIENFYKNRTAIYNSFQIPGTHDSRFNLGGRWGTTATDGSGLGQGDITTLTWSYVADGTPIGNGGCGVPGESGNSNFIAFFNGIYGGPTVPGDFTTAPWHNVFITMFNSWSEVSGLIFVYEPNDDGVAVVTGGAGIPGVRGDMRISGHTVDGNGNVLACNYFPENGDMVIDTADNFYSNNPADGTTNVLTHEIGHGLGIFHVCPVNTTKLMEPFVTFAFLGPQEDDILATNRSYGDPEGNNDTAATASFLGNNANPTSYTKIQRSIDDDADVDFYSFTVSESAILSGTLTPTGTTYLSGVQNNDGSCSAGSSFNALTVSDLMLEVIGTDGVSVIATANTNGLGASESLLGVGLPIAGTYYVRVRQQGAVNNVQMYDLSISLEAGQVEDNDVGAIAILAPDELETGLTDTEQLEITLSNFGALNQTSIPYEVKVNDIVVVSETYTTTLAAGTSVNITVPTSVDLSGFEFYDICVTTLLPSDEDTSNDEVCKTTLHLNCIPTTTTGCNVDGIKQFVLGTINVDNGGIGCNTDPAPGTPNGYANRTASITDLDRRSGFNVHTLQASTRWNNERIKVWIDLNGNGLFTDAGEEVLNQAFTITNGTLETFSITIPPGTSLGNKLLRARAFDPAEDPITTGPCDDIVFGETQDYIVNIIDPTKVVVAAKVFLQGAIINPNTGEESLMRDNLRIAGGIYGTTSPYSDGATISNAVAMDDAGPNSMVDWVWVELRDATDPTIVIEGKSGVLQRDGDLVDVNDDRITPLVFNATAGNYHLVVNHRNHLPIRTAATISLSNATTAVNLSNDINTINGGSSAIINMGNGILAMLGGDFDENGQIQSTDLNQVISRLGSSGYNEADIDMNGQIQTIDINSLLIPNLGRGSQL